MSGILLMVNRLHRGGGTETHVITLAEELRAMGRRVAVLTSGGQWVHECHRRQITVHVTEFRDADSVHVVRTLVRRNGYTVVHAHDPVSCALAARLRLSGVRTLMTAHGPYMLHSDMRRAYRRADRVIAVSLPVWQKLRSNGIAESRLALVPNGVSPDRFRHLSAAGFRRQRRLPAGAFVVGYAGRFTLDKEPLGVRACRSLYEFARRRRHVTVAVAGRGSQDALAPWRGTLLHVFGHVQDMAEFFNACDVVVGTGRVALEAISCDTPTVAVGVSQMVGQITEHNVERALRSNFGDHGAHVAWRRAQLQHAVERVYRDPGAARAVASQVGRFIRHRYSSAGMAKQIDRLYRRA